MLEHVNALFTLSTVYHCKISMVSLMTICLYFYITLASLSMFHLLMIGLYPFFICS
jgi:hypothetical protein